MVKPAKIGVTNFDRGQHIFRRSMDLPASFGQDKHQQCLEKRASGSVYWQLLVSDPAQNM